MSKKSSLKVGVSTTEAVDMDSAENKGRGLQVSTKESGGVAMVSTVSKIVSSDNEGMIFPSKTSSIWAKKALARLQLARYWSRWPSSPPQGLNQVAAVWPRIRQLLQTNEEVLELLDNTGVADEFVTEGLVWGGGWRCMVGWDAWCVIGFCTEGPVEELGWRYSNRCRVPRWWCEGKC